MKKLKITAIALAVLALVLLGILAFVRPAQGPTVPGGVVTSTSQAPLVSADGRLKVDSPRTGDAITSPLVVSGSVTGGGWFFEASFPVKILDADGKVLGQGPAQAGGEPGGWMSTGTVPFVASISFTKPKYATGTVVLSKDNPSGLPQNDAELRVPVKF